MIEIKQLKSFLTAARLMSFTKAAESLYITQSALSKQIASLEHNIGMPLFNRTNTTLTLTPAGQLLLSEGSQLMDKLSELEDKLALLQQGSEGLLRLGIQNAFLDAAPLCFENFKKDYPQVNCIARYLQSQKAPSAVESGLFDAATMHSFEFDFQKYKDIQVMKLYQESFYVLVSPKHPLASKDYVRAEELRGNRIIPLFDSLPPIVDTIIKQGIVTPAEIEEYPKPLNFDDMLLQIKLGFGIALMVRPIALEHNTGLKPLALVDIDSSFDILLIWRKNNSNPVLPLFIKSLKQYFPNAEPL